MKRSELRRGTKQLKRSPLKKASEHTRLKKELWKWFGLYIRTRDKYQCFTCNTGYGSRDNIPYPSAIQAGHFIAKSVGGIELYFDEQNVHAQCYHCNINLGGNQYEYARRLGAVAEELYKRKGVYHNKWTEEDYRKKIEYYKNLCTHVDN